jgi:hypothetical protein
MTDLESSTVDIQLDTRPQLCFSAVVSGTLSAFEALKTRNLITGKRSKINLKLIEIMSRSIDHVEPTWLNIVCDLFPLPV